MKSSQILIIALAVASLACFECQPYEPPQEMLVELQPVEIDYSGAQSTVVNNTVMWTKPNEIQGGCLDGITHGLATGTYFNGYRRITEVWWGTGFPGVYDTLTWVSTQISYTGGNGLCDSVRFTTTNQTLSEHSESGYWYLSLAKLNYSGDAWTYNIAKEQSTGFGIGLDTAFNDDVVYVVWEITGVKLPASGSYGLYDTTIYKTLQGIATGSASKVNSVKLYYANGDTNTVLVNPDMTVFANEEDTLWATVQFTAFPDTARAADTLLGADVFFADGKHSVWDTLNRVVPANNAPKITWRYKLIRG